MALKPKNAQDDFFKSKAIFLKKKGRHIKEKKKKEGETVLDLGAGAGIDVFLAAKKVGPKGYVIGVDMTEPMVEKANKIAQRDGYKNVEFRLGEIENLPVKA